MAKGSTAPKTNSGGLPQFVWRFGSTQRTFAIVLRYIDEVKHRRDEPDYPFVGDGITSTLDMLIHRYNLTSRKMDGTLQQWTPKGLRKHMPHTLGMQKGVLGNNIWTYGTAALPDAYLEKMYRNADAFAKEYDATPFYDFTVLERLIDVEKELQRLKSFDAPSPTSKQSDPTESTGDRYDQAAIDVIEVCGPNVNQTSAPAATSTPRSHPQEASPSSPSLAVAWIQIDERHANSKKRLGDEL